MNRQVLLLFLLFGLLTQCRDKVQKTKKSEQVFAENIDDFGGNIKLKIYSDSTYTFTVIEKSPNYEKTEKFNGFCQIKNDTLYFNPFEFEYTNSEKAVIKNNFIEFISDERSFRIEIKKHTLKIKNRLDFTKFQDYTVFTYAPENKNSEYKPYDINQKELQEIDEILNKCFSENKSKLESKNEYVKQCIAVTNDNNEKEVWIHCYCKSPHIKTRFKYDLIQMKDGGNCNISVKINLTTKEYSQLNIGSWA